MATNFPGSLDSFTNPSSSSTLDSPSHAAQHANINDAMVAVQAKLGVGAGTIGEWTSYTPTFYNMVAGNGTVDFKYAQINKVVHVWGRFVLGSTSTVGTTGAPFFSVPVTGADTFSHLGHASYDDDTGADYFGWVGYRNAGTAYLLAGTASGTYVGRNLLNNVIPFTWATGDRIIVSFTYEAA